MKHFFYLLILFLLAFSKVEAKDTINEENEKKENIVTQVTNKLSGLLNMRYQYSDEDKSSNSFDIRRVRLYLKGEITPSIKYRVTTELTNKPKILDAYLNWHLTDVFNIKAGEFDIPFSLENPYSTYALEMIENSTVITKLSGYDDVAGISANGRDIGVSCHGKFLLIENYNMFEYSMGFFNGNGINVSDNNNSKDFAGTLSIRPLEDITLSASHYNGSTGQQDENIQRIRTGGGARYDNRKLLLRGEYIYGKTGNMDSEGYYVVAGYFVNPQIQILVKYDCFRGDIAVKETQQINYIGGLNYFPFKNFHFKLNYTLKTTIDSPDVNHVAVQFFARF
jgi:hypothetical protein